MKFCVRMKYERRFFLHLREYDMKDNKIALLVSVTSFSHLIVAFCRLATMASCIVVSLIGYNSTLYVCECGDNYTFTHLIVCVLQTFLGMTAERHKTCGANI